jgi:hypothetical protein
VLRKHRTWTIAAGVCVLLVASIAWWSYTTYQERELVSVVTALARETGTQLRDALILDAKPPADQTEEVSRKLEAHFAMVEEHLRKLRSMDTTSLPAPAEAADDYILTGREILRRLAVSHHSRVQFSRSSQALLAHMRADRGGGSWVGEAVRLKNRVEGDFADHQAATETLAKLLASFPAAQARITPYFEQPRLVDETLLDAARQRALASAQQASDEIEKIRKWVPRGQGRHQQK